MTPDQFRSFQQNVVQLRAILQSPVLVEAIGVVLEDVRTKNKVLTDQLEIVSVRTLAYRTGIEDFPHELAALTEPLKPLSEGTPDSTFGQDEAFRKLQEALNDPNQEFKP